MTTFKRVFWASCLVTMIAALAGLWLAYGAALAQQDLSNARNHASQLNGVGQDPNRLVKVMKNLKSDLSSASSRVHDPVWWFASHLPYVGRTPMALITTVDSLNNVLNAAGRSETDLTNFKRDKGILVDPKLLKIASKIIADVQPHILAGQASLSALNLAGVPSVLADPVEQVEDQFTGAVPYVKQGQDFLDVAPFLLGLSEPKTWLLIMNNGAEARATGGMPGGWGTLEASGGRMKLTRIETNTAINSRPLQNWQSYVPADVAGLYGSDLARLSDMNLSPDYPTNASLMNALYRQHTGREVDGVLSVDQFTVAGILAATGPVVAAGKKLDASTVADYLTKGVYKDYRNPAAKDQAVMEITRVVFNRLTRGNVNELRIARALVPSIYRQRVHFWSNDSNIQKKIARTSLSGSMQGPEAPSHMVVLINGAGNKIDAYVGAKVSYTAGECLAEAPFRQAMLSVDIKNMAPKFGLPDYVTPRNDLEVGLTRKNPGSTKMLVYFHVPTGSEYVSAQIEGRQVELVAQGTDHGRTVYEIDVVLPANSKRSLIVKYKEPALLQDERVSLGIQPMAIPMETQINLGTTCVNS